MRYVVQHTELVEGTVEARAYQLEAVDEALTGSMLLVLPTAAGKTAVSWMLIAEILQKKQGWILLLHQQVRWWISILKILIESLKTMKRFQ